MFFKEIIFTLLLGISFISIGQNSIIDSDTMTIYFDVGSSKVKNFFKESLRKIPDSFDLSKVDSLKFMGYADSTGSFKSNQKLSENRVSNVFELCNFYTDYKLKVEIDAFGERTLGELVNNRKVDVIFYFKVKSFISDTIITVNSLCFNADFEALSYCHVSDFKSGNDLLVKVEAMNYGIIKRQKHYYLERIEDGKPVIKRVEWKEK